MSGQQFTDLLAKLQQDSIFREKIKGAQDLESFIKIAKEYGYEVDKADFLNFGNSELLELSDEELEDVSGGISPLTIIVPITRFTVSLARGENCHVTV
jgi:predicted ribosomally synthesized peptide with nif11-like leader